MDFGIFLFVSNYKKVLFLYIDVFFLVDSRFSSIIAGPLAHSVPCVGYIIQEATIPGSLNANLVKVSFYLNLY